MIGRRNVAFRPCACHRNAGDTHRFDETLVSTSCGQDWETHQTGTGVPCQSQEEQHERKRRRAGPRSSP